jgi:hypothetical protein
VACGYGHCVAGGKHGQKEDLCVRVCTVLVRKNPGFGV